MNAFARRLLLASATGLVLVCSTTELGGLAAATATPSLGDADQDAPLTASGFSFQGVPPAARSGDWEQAFRGNWR